MKKFNLIETMGRRKDKTDDIKCSLRMFLRVINIMLGLLMMGLGKI